MAIVNATDISPVNISLKDYEQLLKGISDRYAMTLVPVVVVLAVLMILGLIGNPLVIYFYGFRQKTSVSFMFIVALAVFDLLSCIFTVPLEILDIVYFYTFPSPVACRTFRFFSYVLSIASCTTLIAIAADRFNKVCRPFKRQMTIRRARFVIFGVLTSSLFSSGPSLAFNDVVRVNISDHKEITGLDCTMTSEKSYQIYVTIYKGYLLLFFFVFFLILIIVYSLVGRQLKLGLYKFDTSQNSNKPSVMKNIESSTASTKSPMDDIEDACTKDNKEIYSQNETEGNLGSSSNDNDVNIAPSDRNTCRQNLKSEIECDDIAIERNKCVVQSEYFSEVRSDECETGAKNEKYSAHAQCKSKGNPVEDRSNGKQTNMKKPQKRNINTQRYTYIAISISFAFVVSYLPFLVLSARTVFVVYDPNQFSTAQLIFFEFFYRSYVLNNVCNPIIYGLFNSEFKQMVCNLFGKLLCCKRCSKKLAPK